MGVFPPAVGKTPTSKQDKAGMCPRSPQGEGERQDDVRFPLDVLVVKSELSDRTREGSDRRRTRRVEVTDDREVVGLGEREPDVGRAPGEDVLQVERPVTGIEGAARVGSVPVPVAGQRSPARDAERELDVGASTRVAAIAGSRCTGWRVP